MYFDTLKIKKFFRRSLRVFKCCVSKKKKNNKDGILSQSSSGNTIDLLPNSNQIILKLTKKIEELDYINSKLEIKTDIKLKQQLREIVKLSKVVQMLTNNLSEEKIVSSNLEKEIIGLKLEISTHVKCNEELQRHIKENEIEKKENGKIIDSYQRKLDDLKSLNDQIILENEELEKVNSTLENNYILQKTEENLIILKLTKKIVELESLNSKNDIELKLKSNEIEKLIKKAQEFDDFKKNKKLLVNNDMANIKDLQEKLNIQSKIISDLENKYERYKMYINCILKI
ncbi:227 kDa spindle- and centromere-associated protein-like [Daktulosphaira vitifoliae]|uniref:227 kDa spindle- and centromere-associated protein-like n=1 Tax=Daktulosphaira vitifoliae TaxID=58002 RepID=UPI0021AA3612|nr:227 kDa spindle- and centromere-associated protein-like [Daktulosphaira vitifoliae]